MTEIETLSDYELSFLLVTGESLTALTRLLKEGGADIIYESPVSQIKLAYAIKKQAVAFFGFCNFRAPRESVKKISDDLSLKPEVLRFLIIASPIKPVVRERRPERLGEPKTDKPAPALSNEALEQKLEEILK